MLSLQEMFKILQDTEMNGNLVIETLGGGVSSFLLWVEINNTALVTPTFSKKI